MPNYINKILKKQFSILVVDNDQDYVDNITPKLEAMGFVVDHAIDGRKGKHLSEKNNYHFILLDQMMDDIHGVDSDEAGLELGKYIKTNNQASYVIIVTSRYEFDPLKRATQQAACDDYLEKSKVMFDNAFFNNKISQALQQRHILVSNWDGSEEYEIDPIDFIGQTAIVENKIAEDTPGIINIFNISWKAIPHKPGKLCGHAIKSGEQVKIETIKNGFLVVSQLSKIY
ncbi:MAG: response regulator transcription factor [Desulfovibrio sp.]